MKRQFLFLMLYFYTKMTNQGLRTLFLSRTSDSCKFISGSTNEMLNQVQHDKNWIATPLAAARNDVWGIHATMPRGNDIKN
ncbi:MAG: hypothetical protein LN573_01905 [Rickettsia endosymbiont of Oxypoda opaca]|nr:hypothetical protein [Rickettsia endosymbiont of Oxypoda opaca]